MIARHPAFSAARRKLLGAINAVQQASWQQRPDLLGNNIAGDVLLAMRLLAVHVADSDGEATADECEAYAEIFAPDRQPDVWTVRQSLRDPAKLEQALATVEAYVRVFAGAAPEKPNPLAAAIEQVLQTIVAADGCSAPELAGLNSITMRVRQAALIPSRPASTVADILPPAPPAPTGAPTSSAGSPEPQLEPASPDVGPILASLDRLVGLTSVKREVETLVNLAKVFALRRQMGMAVPDMSFHLVFLGNPGTGKTTVARIVAQLYGKLGMLTKGQLVETDRAGLVGQYVGQTETRTAAVIASALGGVLFIDEAYALANDLSGDYGQEAVATLIKAMEDHRDDLVVIAAGYTDPMHRFIDMNPGLKSRMSRAITFDDYSPAEMVKIFRGMIAAADYVLPPDCETALLAQFQRLWDNRGHEFANARDVRNLFERVVDAQANRLGALSSPAPGDLKLITSADLDSVVDTISASMPIQLPSAPASA